MALIGKIRERLGVFLVIMVGLALVLFTLEGLLTSNASIFRDSKNDLANIAGQSITAQDFEQRVEKMAEVYKSQNKKDNLDQSTMDMLRDQAWNQLLSETVFGKQYEDVGVNVGTDELWDMVQGRFVHPKIKEVPIFQDSITKQFKPAYVVRYLNAIQNDDAAHDQWVNFEDGIRKERLGQKYINLIKYGLYVTSYQAKNDYITKNRIAKAKYVLMNYNTVPDSTVKVSEEDIKTYYNQHESEYKQEASRKIEFVTFDVNPSKEDTVATEEDLKKLSEDFKIAKDDSDFVAINSDTKTIDDSYHKKNSLHIAIDSVIFQSPVGSVFGPYLENGTFKLTKLTDTKESPDSVKARHILLKIKPGEDTLKVKARADSLKKVIKAAKNKNFADLAKKLSEDPGSGAKGGDLGWFAEGAMVKPFNDSCFNGKKGDMPIVESQFGIHLIEIMDIGKSSTKVKIASISKKIEASTRTDREVYNKANTFAGRHNTGESFDKGTIDEKLNKRVADNLKEIDKTVPGLESPRELVRWAYKAKKDEVSKVYQFGNKYVIAHLVEVKEKGIAPLEQVKEKAEIGAKKDKKAKDFIEKMNAQMKGVSKIDDLAKKLNLPVQPAEHITFAAPNIPGAGKEPEVIGTIFTLKKEELSQPVKGNAGVFVVMVEEFTEPAEKKDFVAEKKQLQTSLQQKADYEVFNALKEKANVTDNRGKFY